MTKRNAQRIFSLVLALCMALGACATALAQADVAQPNKANMADFEVLYPLMDLVCASAMYSANAPEMVPGIEGTLTVSFSDAFFKIGQKVGASLGITPEMLTNTDAQANLLRQIFAAQIPQLEPVVVTDDVNGYIGFHPVMVNNAAENGGIQIIGEIYLSSNGAAAATEMDFAKVEWLDRAVFSFKSDATALNGFRLEGFSIGTELNVEAAMQSYFEEIVVEYVNANLGFTVLYPAVFTDDMLVEDANGVSAKMADGSISFFAKRIENTNGASLQDYVNIVADGITDSVARVDEELKFGTVSYTTADGYSVHDVYILNDRYIYQAELSYLVSLSDQYSMYNAYLINSFMVDDVSVG
ncbi:MAG: hypothetical protein RR696_10145 [Clostridia bacterium]